MKGYFFLILCSTIDFMEMAPTTTTEPTPADNHFLVRLPDELITPNNKVIN